MSRLISALLLVAAFVNVIVSGALAGSEPAGAGGWQVLESHGGVRYQPVSEPHWWPVRTGIEIPDGSSIVTGSSGFLIISRAGDSITVHPHSRLELPGGPSSGQVQQEAGHLRYRIARTLDRRFAVGTPYLSLVVKGTVFDVEVRDRGTEVEVTQGLVRVDAPSGQIVELGRGHAARIGATEGSSLEVRSASGLAFQLAPAASTPIGAIGTSGAPSQAREASSTRAANAAKGGKGKGGNSNGNNK